MTEEIYHYFDSVSEMAIWAVALGERIPAAVYDNLYHNRKIWRDQHRGKTSCIYILVNLQDNSRVYVGQTQNLLGRMANYLNTSYLLSAANCNIPISRALLKYGSDNFALVILEYVPVGELNAAESRWIALLNPYYNVSSGGGATSGVPHTDKTKQLLREQKLGTTLSDAHKTLISLANTGVLNSFYGKTHTSATLKHLASVNSAGAVFLYSAHYVLLAVYPSLKTLAKDILANHDTLKSVII